MGSGDISAFTTGEIMYVTLTMMVGAIVHSLIVGQAGGELFFFPPLLPRVKLTSPLEVISEVTSDNTVSQLFQGVRDESRQPLRIS